MNKPYQIAAGRAVQRARRWADERNPVVQLMKRVGFGNMGGKKAWFSGRAKRIGIWRCPQTVYRKEGQTVQFLSEFFKYDQPPAICRPGS